MASARLVYEFVRGDDGLGCKNILIIGENNVCNSYMCGVILQGLLKQRHVEGISVASKGMVVLFSEPVAPLAVSVLAAHDYYMDEFRSSQLTERDVAEADLIITMTDEQVDRLLKDYPCDAICMSLGRFLGKELVMPDLSEGSREDYEQGFLMFEKWMRDVADRLF